MNAFQRRFFAFCIFALSFIMFFEARGERLVTWEQSAELPASASLQQEYWDHVGGGAFVLALGGLLIVCLRRKDVIVPYTFMELSAYALGLGVLIGTAIMSWVRISA